MKNAPNVKALPKDKMAEAIIFAGADAWTHAKDWQENNTAGDTVPPMYLTDEYNIKAWQQRNLPAPDAGSRWTYMGGNYVLITEPEGKILKIYDGEIFYHR